MNNQHDCELNIFHHVNELPGDGIKHRAKFLCFITSLSKISVTIFELRLCEYQPQVRSEQVKQDYATSRSTLVKPCENIM